MRNKLWLFAAAAAVLLTAVSSVLVWRHFNSGPVDEGPDVSAFKALPYLSGAPIKDPGEKSGVVVYKKDKAFDGFNLFNSRKLNSAMLIDMDGNVLHEWEYRRSDSWHHVEMMVNGDLLAIDKDVELVKLDKDSDVIWKYKALVHHDVCVDADGRVYVLVSKSEDRPSYNPDKPVLVDYIAVLSTDGRLLYEVPLLDILEKSEYAWYLEKARGEDSENLEDVLHANSVEVFDGSVSGKTPGLYKKGNILVSFRNIDFIGIYDPQANQLVWGWGRGEIELQHQPTLLPNGDILVFDNGRSKKRSRAVEVDPLTGKVVWQYGDGPSERFFSKTRGGVQPLPNGNTLITESDKGVAFEVTPEKEIVWKYVNPQTFKDKDTMKRGAIYRMNRFAPGALKFLPPDAGPR